VSDIKADLPTDNSETVDKLCELTNGCKFYEPRRFQKMRILRNLDDGDAWDDYQEALADLLGIDEDDLDLKDVDMKDYQIRAYTEKDKDDGNWEIKVYVRQEYRDVDESDDDVIYLVVSSTLDEGDYDNLSITQVDRHFEF
jgi:hypothetical protein